MMKGLKDVSYVEKVRELGLLSLEKSLGNFSVYINSFRDSTKTTEKGISLWCPMTGKRHKLKQKWFPLIMKIKEVAQ